MWSLSSPSTPFYQAGSRTFPLIREPGQNYLPQKPKLLDQVRHALRAKHYALRTEETYVNWIKRFIRFILFHHKRHPQEMNSAEIEQFLTYLAVDQHVAASTQNQALAALLFLYHSMIKFFMTNFA